MNCKSNSSENLERQLGGGVAYIRELAAILGQCVGQERFTINSDRITENLKSPKTKQFAHPPPKARKFLNEQNFVEKYLNHKSINSEKSCIFAVTK